MLDFEALAQAMGELDEDTVKEMLTQSAASSHSLYDCALSDFKIFKCHFLPFTVRSIRRGPHIITTKKAPRACSRRDAGIL